MRLPPGGPNEPAVSGAAGCAVAAGETPGLDGRVAVASMMIRRVMVMSWLPGRNPERPRIGANLRSVSWWNRAITFVLMLLARQASID